jgi:hypothetical protein
MLKAEPDRDGGFRYLLSYSVGDLKLLEDHGS